LKRVARAKASGQLLKLLVSPGYNSRLTVMERVGRVRRLWELLASSIGTDTAWPHLPIPFLPCRMTAKTRLNVNHESTTPVTDRSP
jgi:hypothetical protein